MILHNYEVNHINTVISTMIFIITVLLAFDAQVDLAHTMA